MTYRQIQAALKEFRSQGKTNIKLNQKKEILLAEYERLTHLEAKEQALWIPAENPDGEQWKLGDYVHLYQTTQYDLLQQIAIQRSCEDVSFYRSFYQRAIELGLTDRDPGFDGGIIAA